MIWWLRNRWRLLLALALGGALTVVALLAADSRDSGSPSTTAGNQASTTLPAGAAVSEDGVMVYQDADGKIIVANRDQLPFRVSFTLPRNCGENKKLISDLIADAATATLADADQRSQMLVLDRLAQDLCSWREYNTFAGQINAFWQDNIYLPSTVPEGGSTPEKPASSVTSVVPVPDSTSTPTTEPTANTTPDDNG